MADQDGTHPKISEEERRELERRMTEQAKQGEGAGLAFTDAENVRAAHGSFGNPAGAGGDGHMPGGSGGDGYANYGQNFGRAGDQVAPQAIEDVNRIGRPDEEDAGATDSGTPQADDGRAGRVVFSSGSTDPGSGEGTENEPQSGADLAAHTGNPGTSGGPAGTGGPSG